MKVCCATTLFCFFLPAVPAAQQNSSVDQMQGMQMESQSAEQKSQEKKNNDMQNMPGMEQKYMAGVGDSAENLMNMHPETFLQEIVHHGTSGTSAEPNSTPVPMLMTMKNEWMVMFHANV